jgi:hypothetical protein
MNGTVSRDVIAFRVSAALAVVAGLAGAVSFVFWDLFYRDVPMIVGNLRGTALTMAAIALPIMIASMVSASRGSVRARFIWLGCLGYMAYNAMMFNFAAQFNSLFLLYAALLGLSFWAIVTPLRATDSDTVLRAASHVPVRPIAIYLMVCAIAFAALWLQAVVPAMLSNNTPQALIDAGLSQNTVWVLDFAFTFPFMILGAVWLLQRRAWGYVTGGAMVIMLTIETASIGIDQVFGHLHDPSAPLDAVVPMIVATGVGLVFSALFLSGSGVSASSWATVRNAPGLRPS